MRALLPEPEPDIDLHQYYAADWVEVGGIRANMIASADGAAAADGKSGGLQTPGDNAVFAALRDLADVVLVGWATARIEGYRPVQIGSEQAARRRSFGLRAQLPVAVVTRSMDVDLSAPLFAGAAGTVIVTCASAEQSRRSAAAEVVEVLVCGEDSIDYAAARRLLAERGLTRVLCEGGPTILATVLAAGALDELCLSISPMLTGPGAGRIVAGGEWPGDPKPLALRGLLEDEGALFARYAKVTST